MRHSYTCKQCGRLVAWGKETTTKEKIVKTWSEEEFEQLLSWEGWGPLGGIEHCKTCNTQRETIARLTFDGILSVGEDQ